MKETNHDSSWKVFNNNGQLLGKMTTNKLEVSSTKDTLLKNQVFADVFEIED